MKWAHLTKTNLEGATLTGALLWVAEIVEAKVSGADFSGAEFTGTKIGGIDLGKARGLEAALHLGPSEISTSTLYKSAGRIPEAF